MFYKIDSKNGETKVSRLDLDKDAVTGVIVEIEDHELNIWVVITERFMNEKLNFLNLQSED